MRNNKKAKAGIAKERLGLVGALVIVLNVVLVAAAFLTYSLYNNAYKERLEKENLTIIANLNHSASTNTESMFESWDIKLADICLTVQRDNLNVTEALEMISNSNSSSERFIQLIGTDYTGYLARQNEDGSFPTLSYIHPSYSALQKIFSGKAEVTPDGIDFTPEFTDAGTTAEKHLAVFRYLTIENEDGEPEQYTLMLATPSRTVLELLNKQNGYEGQSIVLVDSEGDYIVRSSAFKSDNFFNYLYSYNNLTLDQTNAIRKEVRENGSGELYYKNAAKDEDCVYRYERMGKSGWYCVCSVPLSSIEAPSFKNSYLVYSLSFILAMFVMDLFWLRTMNARLRGSMQREQVANMAKSSFLSRMSHEIRTPLNAVIGYNTIAQTEIAAANDDNERRQAEMKVMDCLNKSAIASKHLLTIINDVLDMSAIESGKIVLARDNFDFRGFITSLTTVFYSQARNKGIDFEVNFDTLTEEWFVGDQMRVNQVLTNLLSNAIKFTPAGGKVTLKITQPDAVGDSCHVRFEITDTGIGMTEDYISHIWTPFEQADSSISRRFGGSGLGLSITKNLLDIMGGTIDIKSELNKGTTFRVDLTFGKSDKRSDTNSYDFSSVSALVVDDDPSTCDYIRLLFNRCGAKCATVTSGQDAVKAVFVAKERKERYSLCLVDWQMPNMNGIETIERIRDIIGDEMPIVVFTAYDYTELADKAAEVGVTRFIPKPLFQSTLFDLLANICGAESVRPDTKEKDYNFSGQRLILAEDNSMNMEIAKAIISSKGFAIDCASNGKEALTMFEASEPGRYTAILMDVHMPVMDGHEATRAIRAGSHPDAKTIPIIAMTADAFAENVAEAMDAGMNDHVSKPIDVKKLFETLAKYSSQKRKAEH